MLKQLTLLPGSQDDHPTAPYTASLMGVFCDGDRQRAAYRLDEPSGPVFLVEEWRSADSIWRLDFTYEKAFSVEEIDAIDADPEYLGRLVERVCTLGQDARRT